MGGWYWCPLGGECGDILFVLGRGGGPKFGHQILQGSLTIAASFNHVIFFLAVKHFHIQRFGLILIFHDKDIIYPHFYQQAIKSVKQYL